MTVGPADPDTLTLIMMGGAEAPAAMAALVVHVTAALQVQLEPVALTKVRFGPSVSVTVITPELGAVPTLLTRIV
jgi:hypothetical protein